MIFRFLSPLLFLVQFLLVSSKQNGIKRKRQGKIMGKKVKDEVDRRRRHRWEEGKGRYNRSRKSKEEDNNII